MSKEKKLSKEKQLAKEYPLAKDHYMSKEKQLARKGQMPMVEELYRKELGFLMIQSPFFRRYGWSMELMQPTHCKQLLSAK